MLTHILQPSIQYSSGRKWDAKILSCVDVVKGFGKPEFIDVERSRFSSRFAICAAYMGYIDVCDELEF